MITPLPSLNIPGRGDNLSGFPIARTICVACQKPRVSGPRVPEGTPEALVRGPGMGGARGRAGKANATPEAAPMQETHTLPFVKCTLVFREVLGSQQT